MGVLSSLPDPALEFPPGPGDTPDPGLCAGEGVVSSRGVRGGAGERPSWDDTRDWVGGVRSSRKLPEVGVSSS